jgi:hypothetical protein
MSSLLEQAIIDATALKEAAIKNAENAILDKYSNEIREAVENLLEEEEQDAPSEGESASLEDSIPLGAEPTETLDESEMVINLKDLQAMAEELAEVDDRNDGADPLGTPVAHPVEADAATMEVGEPAAIPVEVTLEEEIDISDLDEILEEIVNEELVVDIAPAKSGWAGTPESLMDYKEELRLAQLAGTEAQEQNRELVAARDRLTEQNSTLIDAIRKLKENFDKVNLSNARLIYANRVLTNDSLNERQKNKIVEALSRADSIEEAKVIFETLESAVGSVLGKARPQSLRETVERPSVTLPRRAPARNANSPVSDRMQILAGIKKLDK